MSTGKYGNVSEKNKKYFKHLDQKSEAGPFTVGEGVTPTVGDYAGEPGFITFIHDDGQCSVVFDWDAGSIPVLIPSDKLIRRVPRD